MQVLLNTVIMPIVPVINRPVQQLLEPMRPHPHIHKDLEKFVIAHRAFILHCHEHGANIAFKLALAFLYDSSLHSQSSREALSRLLKINQKILGPALPLEVRLRMPASFEEARHFIQPLLQGTFYSVASIHICTTLSYMYIYLHITDIHPYNIHT